jgi:hypothetical protein
VAARYNGVTEATGAPPARWFQQSLSAGARLVRSAKRRTNAHDLPTALLRGVTALHLAGTLLDVDYKAVHESDQTGWLRLSFITEGLYQQLHATVAMAVMLADRGAANPMGCKSIATYLDGIDRSSDHPLAGAVAAARRELDLLRWLCTVRNKAIQHRAEHGYTGGRSVVMPGHFALLYATDHPTPTAIDDAHNVFATLSAKLGPWEVEPVRSREVITYLDFASHELLAHHPPDYDTARTTIAKARAFDIVVSAPMLENTDTALAKLIALATPAPDEQPSRK